MRCIDNDHINFRSDERFDAVILVDTNGCANTKSSTQISTRTWMSSSVVDVSHRDQTGQSSRIINQRQFFNASTNHDCFSFCKRCIQSARCKILAGHRIANGCCSGNFRYELHIAPSQNPNQFASACSVFSDRKSAHALLQHQSQCTCNRFVWAQDDWIDDDPILAAFDFGNFSGLLIRRHIFVNDSDSTFLRKRTSQRRLGDGVHWCRNQRQSNGNVAGQTSRDIHGVRGDGTQPRNEKHVVKGDSVLRNLVFHLKMIRRIYNLVKCPLPSSLSPAILWNHGQMSQKELT